MLVLSTVDVIMQAGPWTWACLEGKAVEVR